MVAFFFGAIFMGHIYIVAIVTAIQIVSFKEVIAIATVPSRARRLRFTKSLNWYWLATTMYFLYGESVIYYFKHIVLVTKVLLPFATHHRFLSFMLYTIGMAWLAPSSSLMLIFFRICIFRSFPASWPLQVSIYAIRLDAYGVVSHCCTSPFHHEQHFRGHDMVLPSSCPCHLQRHLRISVRNHLWTYPAHQTLS